MDGKEIQKNCNTLKLSYPEYLNKQLPKMIKEE